MNLVLYLAGLFGFLWLILYPWDRGPQNGILGGSLPLSAVGSGQHSYALRGVAVITAEASIFTRNGERVLCLPLWRMLLAGAAVISFAALGAIILYLVTVPLLWWRDDYCQSLSPDQGKTHCSDAHSGMNAMLEIFIGAVLGTIFSIMVTIVVENLRRPNLRITVEPPGDCVLTGAVGGAPQPYKALWVRVFNKQLPLFAGWLERGAALSCRGTITFHHLADGQDVFGRALDARWSGGLQPTAIPIVNANSKKLEQFLVDNQRLTGGSVMDIHSGDSELLDVAARFNGEEPCYGWNNESYFVQPPAQMGRNPRWKLGHERFLIRIVIRSSGHTRVGIFKLINDVPETSFRLEEATRAERERVWISS